MWLLRPSVPDGEFPGFSQSGGGAGICLFTWKGGVQGAASVLFSNSAPVSSLSPACICRWPSGAGRSVGFGGADSPQPSSAAHLPPPGPSSSEVPPSQRRKAVPVFASLGPPNLPGDSSETLPSHHPSWRRVSRPLPPSGQEGAKVLTATTRRAGAPAPSPPCNGSVARGWGGRGAAFGVGLVLPVVGPRGGSLDPGTGGPLGVLLRNVGCLAFLTNSLGP